MLRLAELALFLAPFVLFFIWRLTAIEGGPSVRAIAIAACALALLAGVLIWLSQEDALQPGATYEPARLQGGKIVSGHAAPP
jgi:peptidoglycan/LPS O-acetylase OafA/YrhL